MYSQLQERKTRPGNRLPPEKRELGFSFKLFICATGVVVAIVADLLDALPGQHTGLAIFSALLILYIADELRNEKNLKKYRDSLEATVKERTCKIHELYKQIEFVLGSTNTGLDIIDSDYNIVYIDPEWEKKYGSPAGKKCYEYFMGKKEVCPGCGVKKAIETRRPVVSEEVLIKEGSRPVRVITTPYQDDKGKWMVAEINVDISKEKEMEEELRKHRAKLEALVEERTNEIKETEKRFRLAFENALDSILWADPDTGILLNCNKAAEDLFEKPREDIIGRHQRELHPPESRERYEALFREQINNPDSTVEAEIISKSGKIKTVLISVSATEIMGRRVMQGVFHDITKRKEIEKARHISEENYKAIFESASDAIIIRDIKTYKVLDANTRACEMFCYGKKDMLGLPLQAMLAGNLPHRLRHDWDYYEKASRGEPQMFEVLAKDKMNRTFWVEVSLKRAIIGDKYCLLAITRDITERKYSENKIVDLNKALSKANEGLKHMALRDSHTGLYNHR
jgi:PAS domain S-box-containing protein